jgi:hypothetical protein
MIARAATALAAVALISQVPTPPQRVTPAPETATGVGLIPKAMVGVDAQSFARALAEAGHAAGFIMPTSERQAYLPPDAGHMLTLDEAVAAFTARGKYRVEKQGGAILFRHVTAPADVMAALESPLTYSASTQTFSSVLFGTALRSLARTRVGGAIGPEPGAGPECPVEATVRVAAGRSTTLATLNSVVAQLKGVGWLVRFGEAGERQRLQIGYVCGNGVWSALTVPGW